MHGAPPLEWLQRDDRLDDWDEELAGLDAAIATSERLAKTFMAHLVALPRAPLPSLTPAQAVDDDDGFGEVVRGFDGVAAGRSTHRLAAGFQAELAEHYARYEFHHVVQKLQTFCSEDLGAFYLDVLKDRLKPAHRVSASAPQEQIQPQ